MLGGIQLPEHHCLQLQDSGVDSGLLGHICQSLKDDLVYTTESKTALNLHVWKAECR